MKFGMEVGHKHAYKFCIKYCLSQQKHSEGATFGIM
jgi:hypothetical protein